MICNLPHLSRLPDKQSKEYAVYRSPLLFWGLVELIYDMFRVGETYPANKTLFLLSHHSTCE